MTVLRFWIARAIFEIGWVLCVCHLPWMWCDDIGFRVVNFRDPKEKNQWVLYWRVRKFLRPRRSDER